MVSVIEEYIFKAWKQANYRKSLLLKITRNLLESHHFFKIWLETIRKNVQAKIKFNNLLINLHWFKIEFRRSFSLHFTLLLPKRWKRSTSSEKVVCFLWWKIINRTPVRELVCSISFQRFWPQRCITLPWRTGWTVALRYSVKLPFSQFARIWTPNWSWQRQNKSNDRKWPA